MMLRRLAVAVAAVILTAGTATSNLAEAQDNEPVIFDFDAGRAVDMDDRYLQVNDQIAEFGGAYSDSDGVINIWLTTPSDGLASAAASALKVFVSEEIDTSTIVARQGDYTFAKLMEWKARIRDLHLAVPGRVAWGVSQTLNRLQLWWTDAKAHRAAILGEVERLGIPRDAVVIAESDPVRPASSLQDHHRPLVNGLQIEYVISALVTGVCSLGVVADRSGVRGFVTNSHCSTTRGSVDNGNYWQPFRALLPTDPPAVGVETVDPNFVTGGSCPAGRRCSQADANFVRTTSGVSSSRGRIAVAATGAPTWSGSTRRITSKANVPGSGSAYTVRKVGRTTGHTSGTVANNCANVDVAGTNITMTCQLVISGMLLQGGDSGGPAFSLTNFPAIGDAVWRGIVWGSNDSGTIALASNKSNIESRLGTLTVCFPGFSC